jgi:hypothetical protein
MNEFSKLETPVGAADQTSAAFNSQAFLLRCEGLRDEANRGCGLVYELAVERYSGSITQALAAVSSAHVVEAQQIASSVFEYLSPEDQNEAERVRVESRLCMHWLDPQCCPCGCSDRD